MKQSFKKFIPYFFVLSFLLFFSCQSRPLIDTAYVNDSIVQNYIHSITVKTKDLQLKFDITARVSDRAIYSPVTVNYTIIPSKGKDLNIDNTKICFSYPNTSYYCQNTSLIFTNLQPVSHRITSTLTEQEFTDIIHHADEINLQIITPAETFTVNSDKLRKSLKLLALTIK